MRSGRLLLTLFFLSISILTAQTRRKIIINQDAAGPGGSNLQTILMLAQAADVEVLGITVVTGDQWRDEEVAHTLRLLEILGRTDIPVMKGAEFPLVRTREETLLWEQRYGKVAYAGAWDERWWHEASVVPPLAEGQPTAKPAAEDAVHFLVRMVHQYPNEVTIYEGGPMTNLALAISIDPEFPRLAKELVFMGGSVNPQTDYPEWADNPRHEFNFWFDPEAARIVLRAPWKKIVCTPVDISIKARLSAETVKAIGKAGTPVAGYVERYFKAGDANDLMWDELAAGAWLDPSIITNKVTRFMSVDTDHGAGYGDTLIWDKSDKPNVTLQPVEINMDLDRGKFFDLFASLITKRPTTH